MATKGQYTATSKFHQKMAKAYAQVGRPDDAKSARRAAQLAAKAAK